MQMMTILWVHECSDRVEPLELEVAQPLQDGRQELGLEAHHPGLLGPPSTLQGPDQTCDAGDHLGGDEFQTQSEARV